MVINQGDRYPGFVMHSATKWEGINHTNHQLESKLKSTGTMSPNDIKTGVGCSRLA